MNRLRAFSEVDSFNMNSANSDVACFRASGSVITAIFLVGINLSLNTNLFRQSASFGHHTETHGLRSIANSITTTNWQRRAFCFAPL